MHQITNAPLKLTATPDPDMCRIVCPLCKDSNVTLLTRQVVTVQGPVEHGTKGTINGNIVSVIGRCKNRHHFILRLGNHEGTGLVWVDVPEMSEQAKHKNIMTSRAGEEVPARSADQADSAADVDTSVTVVESFEGHGPVQQVNPPADATCRGYCPVGVKIDKAIAALANGTSNPVCLRCPVLGCPGNPRNGTEAQMPDNLVPGCPWSVEHYAVMAGWEKGTDLAICWRCPHDCCDLNPNARDKNVYHGAHYARAVDKRAVAPAPKAAAPAAATPAPSVASCGPDPANMLALQESFEAYDTPHLSEGNLAWLKERLTRLCADDISEGERKWATRLLSILKHPKANCSINLHETYGKLAKAANKAGLPYAQPPEPPRVVDRPVTDEMIKGAMENICGHLNQSGKAMLVGDYIKLLLQLIAAVATPLETAEAQKVNMPLASFLARKLTANKASVSEKMTGLLERLATAQMISNKFPGSPMITDVEEWLARPSTGQAKTVDLPGMKGKKVTFTTKPSPKKKKP